MTIFWFAMCVWYEGDVFRTARCYHWERSVCEAYFDECYEGRVHTPIRRNR